MCLPDLHALRQLARVAPDLHEVRAEVVFRGTAMDGHDLSSHCEHVRNPPTLFVPPACQGSKSLLKFMPACREIAVSEKLDNSVLGPPVAPACID